MTKAQKRLLAEIEAGQTLVRSFDVYGGYWWWLRPTATKVRRDTVECLHRDGVLGMRQTVRVQSGYQETDYFIVGSAQSNDRAL